MRSQLSDSARAALQAEEDEMFSAGFKDYERKLRSRAIDGLCQETLQDEDGRKRWCPNEAVARVCLKTGGFDFRCRDHQVPTPGRDATPEEVDEVRKIFLVDDVHGF